MTASGICIVGLTGLRVSDVPGRCRDTLFLLVAGGAQGLMTKCIVSRC